jgi:hypothetical protein
MRSTGARALNLDRLPPVLDIEASGFGTGSYPIEVGWVLADGRSFCSLIRPLPQWTRWDPKAEEMHHISRKVLGERGRDIAEVTRLLDEHLRGQTVYTDGWANDYTWLHQLYDAVDRLPSFRLESLRALLDDQSAARWAAAKSAVLQRTGMPRHRASADARVMQLALAELGRAGEASALR